MKGARDVSVQEPVRGSQAAAAGALQSGQRVEETLGVERVSVGGEEKERNERSAKTQ